MDRVLEEKGFLDLPIPTEPDDHAIDKAESRRVILYAIYLMVGLFTILLTGLCHNVSVYVIGQGRCKTFHILLFYILAFIIIGLRIIVFLSVAKYLLEFNKNIHADWAV